MVGYIGSIFMVVFSFTLIIPYAILGLGFLTIQSTKLKAHNLTALNLISIIGFLIQFFS